MGREVRMVPPNWEHPKVMRRHGFDYKPMFDRDYATAKKDWDSENAKWNAGERPDYFKAEDHEEGMTYAEYEGESPDPEYYRPFTEAEATWFQIYETVSEGTPVSPPFATKEELIAYLMANGDFWDQSRRAEGRSHGIPCGPWTREQAVAVVNGGWAPSMAIIGGKILDSKEAAAELAKQS